MGRFIVYYIKSLKEDLSKHINMSGPVSPQRGLLTLNSFECQDTGCHDHNSVDGPVFYVRKQLDITKKTYMMCTFLIGCIHYITCLCFTLVISNSRPNTKTLHSVCRRSTEKVIISGAILKRLVIA